MKKLAALLLVFALLLTLAACVPYGGETPQGAESANPETVSATAPATETVPSTEPVLPSDTAESLETEPTEPEPSELPAEPTILASGRFGLRQREEEAEPDDGAELPYFKAVDTDTEDQLFTNNAVEIRYDGVGVWQRARPDGEEQLLFPLERVPETNYHLFAVTENRLYFTSNNAEDPFDWWGVKVFYLDHQGKDRQELGGGWDYFFRDGWTALLSFHTDVRPTTALIFNRNDELVVEEAEERVWDLEPMDGSLYCIWVREYPKEGGDSEWYEDLISLAPDGTQTVLMQIPVSSDYDGYGVYANIYNGVISFDTSSGGLYDLYTLEPLEDRYDSSIYDDSLTWTLDDTGLLTICGTGVMGDCWQQPWKEYQETIKTVVLQDGVTNIGDHAFFNCAALRSVTIPDSVTSIGDSAFSYCEALTDVTVPDSVTHLGSSIFCDCYALTNVTLSAGLTKISDNLFFSCESLRRVVIPDSVTAIGNYSFDRCSALTEIIIPTSVTRVGESAFWSCPSLSSVTIPASVTDIGKEAFGWDAGSSWESERISGFTICGAEGSAAQSYAEENGFQFVKVN